MSDYDIACDEGADAVARRFGREDQDIVHHDAMHRIDRVTAAAVLDAAREQGAIVFADELREVHPSDVVHVVLSDARPRVLLTHRDPS